MNMKLYFSRGACSLAVRILINEIGAQCDYEAVNLQTKKTAKDEDFFAINPKGAVPVLVTDDNQVLTENAVIQQYLAEKYKATNLLPASTDFKRYRILEWLNFVSTDLHKGCTALFNPMLPEEEKEKFFRPMLKRKFEYVDGALKGKKYLLGDDYTLPDGYLFVVFSWLPHLGMQQADFPNIQRHTEEMKQREAVKLSLQQEAA